MAPSIDTATAKAALRERIIENRRALDARGLSVAARALRDVVLAMPEVAQAQRVATYVSVGNEPGTGPLLESLSAQGTDVLLPILLPDGDLDWATYTGPRGLVAASRGMLEPVSEALGPAAVTTADVVLAPGLAVDQRGVRLGRGGGSFDRALARAGGRAFTCVLLYDGEVLDIPVPRELHDVPVTAAATPSTVQLFA
ncbi:MAG TPA: 5-formyltetrahydrofolate cyclo-ligase [Jiangellaceae bacterium]|nr:5-formyltetrahydrofolate cyclo-ligase [Jiangellaceae bacterium]